jgi:hypothetical protein
MYSKDLSLRSKWFGFCTSRSRRRFISVKEIGLRLTLRRVKDGLSSIQFVQDIRQMERASRTNILDLINGFTPSLQLSLGFSVSIYRKTLKVFQSHSIPSIPPKYLTNSAKQDDMGAL